MGFINKSLDAIYRKPFADVYTYGGNKVFCVQDNTHIEVEYTHQRALKIRTSDVTMNGDDIAVKTISKDGVDYDIISWQYHGNRREEIILVIEGDQRGY